MFFFRADAHQSDRQPMSTDAITTAADFSRRLSGHAHFRPPAATTTTSWSFGKRNHDREWSSPEAEAATATAAELPHSLSRASTQHGTHGLQAEPRVRAVVVDGPATGSPYPHYEREWPSQQAEAAAAAAAELPRNLAGRIETQPLGEGGSGGGMDVGGEELYPDYGTDWPSPEAEAAAAAASELPRSISGQTSIELGAHGAGVGGGPKAGAGELYPDYGTEWPSQEVEAEAAAAAERQPGMDDSDLPRGTQGRPQVRVAASGPLRRALMMAPPTAAPSVP